MLAFPGIYFCPNLMKLAEIFQVLEHRDDFQTFDNDRSFVFQNEANIFTKDLQAMTSYGLVTYCESVGPIIREI